MKVTFGYPKTGKSYQKEIEDEGVRLLLGKKLGQEIPLDKLGLAGYTGVIRGGSDAQGFPMREDVEGTGRKRILLTYSVGQRDRTRGTRKRKGVRGNTISDVIAQVNIKITKEGPKKLAEIFGETPKAEGKKEKPAKEKEKKEAPKKEPEKAEGKEEPKEEEKPKEEKK